jgi:sphingolipid delta-4 desaturase
MGDMELDAGVPGPTEARVVGQSNVLKGIWIALTCIVQGVIRPHRMTKIQFMDTWTAINAVVQIACMALLWWWAGWTPFRYLIMSTIFGIGLHPVGARWVQEHFALVPDQETYSYYGPLNRLSFNVGYHNEHHDIVTVPWSRLPKIRRAAPEFYDRMQSYSSWTALLVRFLRDREITLFHYVVRPHRATSITATIDPPERSA